MNNAIVTVTGLQDKLIKSELSAIAKHGKGSLNARRVILGARTRFQKAIMQFGFDKSTARDMTGDAVDMVNLHLLSGVSR